MNEACIYVCDDEAALRRMVVEYLTERGYRCVEAEDVAALRARLAEEIPDLVLLDVRMPGEDGLSALRDIRARPDAPAVIMLTAVSDTVDRIVGLELGADDYLAKPVDLRELDARIKAVLRRKSAGAAPMADGSGSEGGATDEAKSTVSFGACTLDLTAARLRGADGEDIEITAMEFALLKTFSENRGRVLSRDQLLDLAHHRVWEPFDRSIDLRISRLRRKVEPDPSKPSLIRTVRGIGYVFSEEQ